VASPRAGLLILLLGCRPGNGPSAPPAINTPVAAAPTRTASAPPSPPPSTAGAPPRLVRDSFHSEALGVDKSVVVWLPAGYDGAGPRFPVIYLIHGFGGDQESWVRLGLARVAERVGLQAIVVMPDGDDGFYANWVGPVDYEACLRTTLPVRRIETRTYCVRQPRYEDYIVRDLVGWVDGHFRTKADRTGRGLEGMSMGGFGSLELAMRHPGVFSVAASHSGLTSLLYEGPHPFVPGRAHLAAELEGWGQDYGRYIPPLADHIRMIFGDDPAHWRAYDPASLAENLQPDILAAYLDCGTEDEMGLDDQARHLDEVLTARGVAHDLELVPGRHDGRFFAGRLEHGLRFMAAHLSAP
jgi:putative tributyrin esterase